MIRTAIFGGSFNPIHRGHIALAEYVIQHGWADEVWLMVSPQNPLKHSEDLMPEQNRLEWAQMAVRDIQRVEASDFEFQLSRPSYTYNTLQALRTSYPNREFVLLIGSDNWQRFGRWVHHDEIMSQYELLVYPRNGSPIDADQLPQNVHLLPAPVYPISSTEIRKALLHQSDVTHLLPAALCSDENISLISSLLRK